MALRTLKLFAQTAARQRSRHREFRFRFGFPRRGLIPVRVRARRGGFTAQLGLRQARGDASDGRGFAQVFLQDFYNLARLDRWPQLQAACDRRRQARAAPLILDLGANIGLAGLYLAHLFPGAQIVAVEPDAGNFARLQAHWAAAPGQVAPLLLHAAVAGADGWARITNPQGPAAGRRTAPAAATDPAALAALSLPTLLQRAAALPPWFPWLVKVDIEGAEADLFAGDLTWLDPFPLVLIEPHDWTLPGSFTPALLALAARRRHILVVGESLLALAPEALA